MRVGRTIMKYLNVILLSLVFGVLSVGCSGNSNSSRDLPSTLDLISGVVQNGYADNISIKGFGVGKNGQLSTEDESAELAGVKTLSNLQGRYSLGVAAAQNVPIILF